MIKRINLLLLAILVLSSSLHAQVVIMKDGTVYDGYISEQTTDGKACVTYTSASFTLPADSIDVFFPDSKANIRWGQRSFVGVDILEEGDWITFRTQEPGIANVCIDDIERITYPKLDYLHDVVVADQSYEGTVVEMVLGKYLKMDVDGKRIVIAEDKIRNRSKVSIDKLKSLNIKMFPYLDVYELTDMPTITGALISQNYLDGQIIFLSRDGSLMPLPMNKIASTRRIPNQSYEEVAAPVVSTFDIRINKMAPKWIDAFDDKKGIFISSEDLAGSILSVQDTLLRLDTKEGIEGLVLFQFNPFSAKSGAIYLGKKEDVLAKQLLPSSVTTSSGYRITEYDSVEYGFYILYDSNAKRVAGIWVN